MNIFEYCSFYSNIFELTNTRHTLEQLDQYLVIFVRFKSIHDMRNDCMRGEIYIM